MWGYQNLYQTGQDPFSQNSPHLLPLWTLDFLQKAEYRVYLPEIIHPPSSSQAGKVDLYLFNPNILVMPKIFSSHLRAYAFGNKVVTVLCFCFLSYPISSLSKEHRTSRFLNRVRVGGTGKSEASGEKNRLVSQNVISPHSHLLSILPLSIFF